MAYPFSPASYLNSSIAKRSDSPYGRQYLMPVSEVMHRRLHEPASGVKTGPFLGCKIHRSTGGERAVPLFQKGQGNLLTLAPPGAGKSSCLAINCALTWPSILVSLDPKGEIARSTLHYRREVLGQDTIVMDPFGILYEGGGHSWNVLDELLEPFHSFQKGEESALLEDLAYLGRLLIERDPDPQNRVWSDWADQTFRLGLLSTLSLASTGAERDRSLADALIQVASDREKFLEAVAELQSHSDPYLKMLAGMIGDAALAEEQFVGIRTTLFRRLESLGYPNLRRSLGQSDVMFRHLRRSNRPTTIYIVIPPHELTTYKPKIRLVIGWILRCLMQSYDPTVHDHQAPVMFLMDEVAQLGYMDVLESAMQIARGYNIKFWFFIQSVSFLEQYYPKSWKLFFETAETISTFGLADIDTAERFSRMAGSMTVIKPSYSENANTGESFTTGDSISNTRGPDGSSSTRGTNHSQTYSTTSGYGRNFDLVGRRVIMPEELLRLPSTDQMIFMRGLPPIQAQKVHFKSTQQLASRSRPDLPLPELDDLVGATTRMHDDD